MSTSFNKDTTVNAKLLPQLTGAKPSIGDRTSLANYDNGGLASSTSKIDKTRARSMVECQIIFGLPIVMVDLER